MKTNNPFFTTTIALFKQQALAWIHLQVPTQQYDLVFYLDSNEQQQDKYSNYECLIALANYKTALQNKRLLLHQPNSNSFKALQQFYDTKKDWLFGFFSYDLKNEIEALHSQNKDGIQMPDCFFVQPEIVITLTKTGAINIRILGENQEKTAQQAASIFQAITAITSAQLIQSNKKTSGNNSAKLQARISHTSYIEQVKALQQHIQLGNIYEVNFCQEFYQTNLKNFAPCPTFVRLNKNTQAPFAAFVQLQNKYLLCASPERFLKKMGPKIISQPIKGTIKRGANLAEDEALKKTLYHDPKERAENVMIVDLVRNDLTPTAQFRSVQVEELFGVYTFKTVHHLISTISAQLRPNVPFTKAIRHAFPMGSMTGAPKVRAMQLIEQYEWSKRGLYSGSVGYISPSGDFDFNVVIRSLLYNADTQYLSLQVGGAITAKAIPEKEFEECLLKAEAVLGVI